MYQSHIVKLTTAGKKFWRTKKLSMRLIVVDKPVELNGTYWDGGSRNSYYGQDKNGNLVMMNYSTSPVEFGGSPAPSIMPTDTMAVVKSGIFLGKDAGITAYVNCLDGWMNPLWIKA
jgi:hypothetical protein